MCRIPHHKTVNNCSWQDRFAHKVAQVIIHVQHGLAGWLSKREQTLTRWQKQAALFIFCMSVSGYLLYTLERALFHPEVNTLPAPVIAPPPALYPGEDTLLLPPGDSTPRMPTRPQHP